MVFANSLYYCSVCVIVGYFWKRILFPVSSLTIFLYCSSFNFRSYVLIPIQ